MLLYAVRIYTIPLVTIVLRFTITTIRVLRIVTAAVLIALSITNAHAQDKRLLTYNGSYEGGTAVYTYYEAPTGERVYHGPFKFIFTTAAGSVVKEGRYMDGKKDGAWSYMSTVSTKLELGAVKLTKILKGSYTAGEPNGTWTISQSGEGNAKGAQVTLRSSGRATFDNGVMVKDFSYEEHWSGDDGEQYRVAGQFDNNGNMDGTWTVTFKVLASGEVIEDVRDYRRGFLVKSLIRDKEKGTIHVNQENSVIVNKLAQLDTVPRKVAGFGVSESEYLPNHVHVDNAIDKLTFGNEYLLTARKKFCGEKSDICDHCGGFIVRDFEKFDLPTKVAAFTEQINATPDDAYLYGRRAFIYDEFDEYDTAIVDWSKAISLQSGEKAFFYYRGYDQYRMKNYAQAIQDYEEAIRLDPSYAQSHADLGWTYYLNGDFQKCLEHSEKAVSLDPSLYYAHYNAALALLRLGRIKDAKSMYADTRKMKGNTATPGAIDDLNNLVAKGIMVDDARSILKEIFNVPQ